MPNKLRFYRLIISLTLAIMLLFGFLATLPTTAQEPTEEGPPLHYKSEQGLMPPAYVADPAMPLLRAAEAMTIPYLRPYTTTFVGSWPQVVAAADFNSDGHNEVAAATAFYFDDENDDQLHLFVQAGGTLSLSHKLPAGQDPEAMLATDLDLDGRPDVALALAGDEQLALYHQIQTPTQGLTGPLTVTLPSAPNALGAGDFDDDLWDDLAAIVPFAGQIRLWANQPTGIDDLTTLPYETGGFDDITVGDVDNDGDDDIAALRGAGFESDSVIIFIQDAGDFSESYTLSPEVGGYLPHSLTLGDVNGDGRDDLLVTAGGNTPHAYLNIFLQDFYGHGLLAEPEIYETYHLPSALTVGDINHDGLEDVVLVNEGWRTLSVYTQTADHTLAGESMADLPYASRYRPDALTLADMDSNGSLDVGAVGYYHDLAVLYNTLTAPTAVISSPLAAQTIVTNPLPVSGSASSDAVAVEVRLKGYSDWQPATLSGGLWQTDLAFPDAQRPWWVEARAIDANGHYQAPPDQRRVRYAGLSCQIYAIHDKGADNSQMFTVDFTQLEPTIQAYGPVYKDADIEALEINPKIGQIYGVKSFLGTADSELHRLDPTTDDLLLIGSIQDTDGNGFREVDSLSFHPDGSLWGFAKGGDTSRQGLIQIDPGSAVATMTLQSDLEVEGLAWSPDGSTLWLSVQNELYSYVPGGSIIYEMTVPSDIDSLGGGGGGNDPPLTEPRIEGLEFRPDDLLLTGLHHSDQFNIYALDISSGTAEVILTDSFETNQFNDVEGIAWPDWCDVTHLPMPLTADPALTTTLVYTDGSGHRFEMNLPVGAIDQETTFTYTDIDIPVDDLPNFVYAEQSFRLTAYQAGDLVPGFTFNRPVTVTLHYNDADVSGLDEASLKLRYWDWEAHAWLDAACGEYVRNPAENWFSVPVCHLTEFGMFGLTEAETDPDSDPDPDPVNPVRLFLPLILKTGQE